MTATVHDIPTATTKAARRVDDLCKAITHTGPREWLWAEPEGDCVRVFVGDLELGITAEEAEDFGAYLIRAAKKARGE